MRLSVPLFQCFFIRQETGELIKFDDGDVKSFLTLRRQHFGDLYLHGSYWINLAGIKYTNHYCLKRELHMARWLEFTHIVLHPGAAKGARNRVEGIDAMARVINATMKHEHDIKIVIENGAHGNFSVGGDLHDFQQLLTKLDHPEKILFCIDTAHAHSYGYNIIDAQPRQEFIDLLSTTIGIQRIAVLHVNDTQERRGSRNDRHEVVGKGVLGDAVLRDFVMHPLLVDIPIIMELPVIEEDEEQALLNKVISWQKGTSI